MKKSILSAAILAFLSLPASATGPSHGSAQEVDAGVHEASSAATNSGDELLVSLRIPLTSPLFSETPVAVVNEEPITVRDLTRSISSTHSGRADGATSARKNYANLLARMITTKLIVQEAKNIGFDEMPDIASQIEAYSTKRLIATLVAPQLEAVEPDEESLDELYREMSQELLLTTLKFRREEDAVAFEKEYKSGADFDTTARRFIGEGRADGEIDGKQYMKLKDLLPEIAKTAYTMKVDSVSPIFSASEGFVLFRLEGLRFYEDPAVREEARRKLLEPLRKKVSDDFVAVLIEKYATIDEALLEEANFDWEETGFLWARKQRPVDFEKLRGDQRVLATVHTDEPFTVTVADVANKIEERHFHGLEKAAKKQKLNEEKRRVLRSMLFERAAVAEALAQGKDQDADYLKAVDKFTSRTLFDAFVSKVVVPDVTIEEAEAKTYYQEHLSEFSSPTMYRMNSLAFSERSDAEKALAKLRKRADFKWVSANSPGLVEGSAALFDNALLSPTAMPEDLHETVERARQGDSILYSSPDGRHHVIVIEKTFPSEPKPYEAARTEIAKIIFDEKVADLIDDWGVKLREAYDTRIFITGLEE